MGLLGGADQCLSSSDGTGLVSPVGRVGSGLCLRAYGSHHSVCEAGVTVRVLADWLFIHLLCKIMHRKLCDIYKIHKRFSFHENWYDRPFGNLFLFVELL